MNTQQRVSQVLTENDLELLKTEVNKTMTHQQDILKLLRKKLTENDSIESGLNNLLSQLEGNADYLGALTARL